MTFCNLFTVWFLFSLFTPIRTTWQLSLIFSFFKNVDIFFFIYGMLIFNIKYYIQYRIFHIYNNIIWLWKMDIMMYYLNIYLETIGVSGAEVPIHLSLFSFLSLFFLHSGWAKSRMVKRHFSINTKLICSDSSRGKQSTGLNTEGDLWLTHWDRVENLRLTLMQSSQMNLPRFLWPLAHVLFFCFQCYFLFLFVFRGRNHYCNGKV